MVRHRVVAALATAALLAPAAARAHAPNGVRGGDPVAAGATPAETIKARQRFFGAENVDARTGAVRRDRVIFSWFGVTNFALAIRGHVLLLDAWVPRGEHSGYVPTTPAELATLKPEAIILGHAHFDHAADAVPIAQASGATIVGTAEHCAAMRERAASALPPRCVEAIAAGAPPGTSAGLDLVRGVELTALKHVHSGARAPDGDDGYHVPVTPPPAPDTVAQNPPTSEDLVHLLGHLPDDEGGTVLYRFRVGDLTLVWHDSAGPLADDAPEVLDKLRALGPVDVELGAIQGFNQLSNGMRDPRMYIEAIGATTFVPTHHDDWAPGVTTKGANYEAPFNDEFAKIPPERRPSVRFIKDPADYIRPAALTFPVAFDGPRLVRRCVGRGRLRVALRGDLADVAGTVVRLGRRTARTAPVLFGRRSVRAALGRRLRATVALTDGSSLELDRNVPSCGIRR